MSFTSFVAAPAHESPEHSVEEITEHIQQEGESVALLLIRASHYRVLGQTQLAIADLQRVLQIEPQQRGALVELARIHYTQGNFAEAMQWITRAIENAKDKENIAHVYAVRGDIYNAQNNYRSALQDYNRAIAGDPVQVEWYLQRSRLQELSGLKKERIKGLEQGHRSTRSALLYTEWIEALIDGGQARQALKGIDKQLSQARLKSSWLIRRARALLALKPEPEYSALAQKDLQAAIAEINGRLRLAQPDLDLLLDRALAHLLSGNAQAARSDFIAAKEGGATPRQLEKLQYLLEAASSASAKNGDGS